MGVRSYEVAMLRITDFQSASGFGNIQPNLLLLLWRTLRDPEWGAGDRILEMVKLSCFIFHSV